jgi:hypothetical protein
LTTVVLIVLAIAWGAVLVFWLRSRAEGAAFNDSVGLFHRHLRVLERTAPSTLAAANRLRARDDGPIPLSSHARVRAGQPAEYATRRVGPGAPRRNAAAVPAPLRPRGVPSASAARRRASQRRRRDVLFVLTVLVVATAVLAVGTGSHLFVVAQLVCDAALAGYVALLVRLRTVAAERDMSLRLLERPARPAYATYGDLALRRVAN